MRRRKIEGEVLVGKFTVSLHSAFCAKVRFTVAIFCVFSFLLFYGL